MPFLNALTSLAITLALLLLCAWVWKRWGSRFLPGISAGLPLGATFSPAAKRRMVLTETLRLSVSSTLYMVEIDGTPHVIAVNAGQTVLLTSPTPVRKGKVQA